MALEIHPERGVGDGHLADLLALREDRKPLTLVVEVLELDRFQSAFSQPVVEQESQRDPVAEILSLGEDRPALIGGEGGAIDLPGAGSLDRQGSGRRAVGRA